MTDPRAQLGSELGRKALHLLTAALPVAWGTGLLSATNIRWTLGVAVLIALSVEWVRLRTPAAQTVFSRAVGPLLRAHEARALTGATWLAAAMWLAAMFAPERAAIAALWAAAVGDASGALVGRLAQRPGAAPAKTLVGSLAVAATSALGVVWLIDASALTALALGLVAAIAERPRGPGDDNLRVTLATALAAVALGLR